MTDNFITYRKIEADQSIADFVECFWMAENSSGIEKEVIVMPDASFDLVLSQDQDEPFQICLLGLGTSYDKRKMDGNTKMYFISFKLISAEYLFNRSIADLINEFELMPNNFWGFEKNDLTDFDTFCLKATNILKQLIPKDIDNRKKKLFELIYASNGEMSVAELAEKSFLTSRQINRYFSKYFGISLKAYCGYLRFKESFEQIKNGELFPKLDFSDQAHFSREVKKLSGVNPRELYKNQNDRFIQVSAIPDK
ncbi:AraC-like DNA-binding protein [Flavobacterium nitrogenifigens]|uniref:AraC-like DNA-binding protein n=2 Tax=Flavobacterium TaxID=237 RepID=A0A7W7IXT9_9FLAO|nr:MULTISPECIES: AraC family transcriptional regulator [Flavobacterium]MBB4802583.1 AraC-like DNA-binding protein [Flavobacterium nitrogenifigens]MBB6387541.1 AraC-like DNA-binding protein [Flavobacterium notoginsengisoli]